MSDNSYDEIDGDEEKSYLYDEEESQHQMNEDTSREGDQSMLGQVLEDDVHDNNRSIEYDEQLELRNINKSTNSSENIVEENIEAMQKDLDAAVCSTSRGNLVDEVTTSYPGLK